MVKKIRSKKYSFLYVLFGMLFLLVLQTQNIYTQYTMSRTTNEKGVPGAMKKGAGTINPYNGSLTFSLPLASISGRGEVGYEVPLVIKNQWSVKFEGSSWTCTNQPNCVPNLSNSIKFNQEDGILPGFSPGVLKGRRSGDYDWREVSQLNSVNSPFPNGIAGSRLFQPLSGNGANPYVEGTRDTLTKLTFSTNDGSVIELFDEATKGEPQTAPCNSNNPAPGFNRGNIFSSIDGNNVTFVSDVDIRDFDCSLTTITERAGGSVVPFTTVGHLYFPNGTVYRIENGYVKWMRDRNGNMMNFDYDQNPSWYVSATDSAGRETELASTAISTKGTNGQTRSVIINRDYLQNLLRPTSGYSIQPYSTLFSGIYNPTPGDHNPYLISSVQLPNGQFYRFYYNSYGELARVEMPTGGAVEYDYGAGVAPGSGYGNETNGALFWGGSAESQIYRRVYEERIYPDGGSGNDYETKTTYSLKGSDDAITVDSISASGVPLSRTKYYYHGDPALSLFEGSGNPSGLSNWLEGREYKTESLDTNGTTVLTRTEQNWDAEGIVSWWTAFCSTHAPYCSTNSNHAPRINPHITSVTTTLVDTNQVSKKTFSYDSFNNLTDIYEYDFGIGVPGAFKRRTHTNYVTDTNYTSHTGAYLRGLPSERWVSSDVAGYNKVSKTEFKYDETALLPRSNVVGWTDPNNLYRGNLTKTRSWLKYGSEPEVWLETKAEYDVLGNVIKAIDARNKFSTIDYTDRFGLPDGEARGNTQSTGLTNQSTFAFPTSATNPLGWTAYTQFDYFTGQVVNTEDISGVISKTLFNDDLDRPTQIVTAVGVTNYERQTTVIYYDDDNRIKTTSDLNALNDNLLKTESFYDGLGRTVKSHRYEADGNIIVAEADPFEMIQDPETSVWRAGTKVSNPYRLNTGEQIVWTMSLNDSLGRTVKVLMPEGTVKTEYSGNSVTVTDQAGKKRRSVTNALGQRIEVHEPNNDGNLGTVDTPVQPTIYSYNVLNNLLQVQQNGVNTEQCGVGITNCTQTRTFAYDSLSRLRSATNPESGIINYQYDNNGNLTKKTDARGVVTDYNYDDLNRIKTRVYSAPAGLANYSATPTVTYYYDGTYLNAQNQEDTATGNVKGNLTSVSSSASRTNYTTFDNIGRVTQSQQITDGVVYNPMTYKYNLSGALVEQTYPSGRVVKNVLDNDGDLSGVQSKKNSNAGYWNYAQHFTYNAAGAVTSMQLGNGTWESTIFNSRLQPTQIALGSVQNGIDRLKLNYTYKTTGQNDNNGNVLSQTITVPALDTNNPGFTAVQNYTYDSLNRLKSASETIVSQTWKQTYNYDRYGNRTFKEAETTTLSKECLENSIPTVCDVHREIENPSIDPANNRIKEYQPYGDSSKDYEFDSAGNVTKDADGKTFTYDGENKQVKVEAGGSVIGEYWYDGGGKRVKKRGFYNSQWEETIFVYDALGKLVAEYSNQVEPVETAKVSYLTTDHLGSSRITTNKDGAVTSRRDFMPFGEEISTTQRTSGLDYTDDKVRQKFTGYLKDKETKLDFAKARMYENQHGRFTAVDPLLASGNSSNPQTFNRYTYVLNNPLVMIDITGEYPVYFKNVNLLDGNTLTRFSRIKKEGFSQYKGRARTFWQDGQKIRVTRDAITCIQRCRNVPQAVTPTAVAPSNTGGLNDTGNAFIREMGARAPAVYNIVKWMSIPVAIAAAPVTGTIAIATTATAHESVHFGVALGIGASLLTMPPCVGGTTSGGGSSSSGPCGGTSGSNLTFPDNPEDMDELLGFEGERIPDGTAYPGRNKVVWRTSNNVKITFEQHPYHTNAPSWHRGPHFHVDTPGNVHVRYMPGDPIP